MTQYSSFTRILFGAFGFVLLALVGCKEDNHGIVLSATAPPLKDTTYVLDEPPPAAFKKVLLEDVTGVRCVNCPNAAAMVKTLLNKYDDTLVAIALYIKSFETQFTRPWSGFEDLRTQYAEDIAMSVGMPIGLPGGYVDRFRFAASAALGINQWDSRIQIRKALPSPVQINLDYERINDSIVFKTKLTYSDAVPDANHKVAFYITEDKVIGKQATNDPDLAPYILDYEHNHVLRASVDLPLGRLLTQPLVAGRVFERDMIFKWNPQWVLEHCNLVAVVMNVADESVVQVEELKLTP